MLTGSDLLARVKELGDCAKTDLAKGCGYVVTKKDGSEQVLKGGNGSSLFAQR